MDPVLKGMRKFVSSEVLGQETPHPRTLAEHFLLEEGTQETRKRTQEESLAQMNLEQEDRTGRIIGAAIEVHRARGPGFLESVYADAVSIELAQRGIPFVR